MSLGCRAQKMGKLGGIYELGRTSGEDSALKSRDTTLPTKVHRVQATVFPEVMYGCESCTIRKAEHSRIGAFKLWCWRRLLRVPWTARRSSLSRLGAELELRRSGSSLGPSQ